MSTILLGLVALLTAGCVSYYKVTDTNSGKVYYTQAVTNKDSGAVAFTDAETKANVTLQSSEVREVSEDTFREGVAAE
ncbi:MAG TPA: hypothetical protein VMZ31_06865 [Phycisphaerae bacterium]|nr:hypothetical protein [Phycisphaerae bacterium]